MVSRLSHLKAQQRVEEKKHALSCRAVHNTLSNYVHVCIITLHNTPIRRRLIQHNNVKLYMRDGNKIFKAVNSLFHRFK